jgi:protein-disulfide isomerase
MARNTKRIVIAAIGISMMAVTAVVYLYGGGTDPLTRGGGRISFEVKPTDRVQGKANAPVTMIEYASMTCPHCAAFDREVLPLIEKNYIDTGKVKYVFRDFPLDGAARMASAVARCLPPQSYYAFIDLLYSNQDKWIKDFDGNGQLTKEVIIEGLTQMGRMAGMSRDQVVSCADNPANLAAVDANWQEGQSRYHVNSTPTFIVDGHQFGPNSADMSVVYKQFQSVLDPLIAAR